MTKWPVLLFSGDGSFDHEADIREATLILTLPRPEEGLLHPPQGTFVWQSILCSEQQHQCPAELVRWPECWAMFQQATFEACCLHFSFVVFLITCERCLLTTASQQGESETSFASRPPTLGLRGASSAVPKEVSLVAKSAADCCCCLRSTDKWPIHLSHHHSTCRVEALTSSTIYSTCCFGLFSTAVEHFLPVCAKCLQWTQLACKNSTLRAKGVSTVAQQAKNKMAAATTML